MPPGRLAVELVDPEIIRRGILPPGDLYPPWDPEIPFEERKYPPPLGDKLRMLFDNEYPNVHGVFVQPVWCAGDLLEFGGDFHKYISGRDLAKQEGLIFRHILKLILLLGEFSEVAPPGVDPDTWRNELQGLAERFTASCRAVDPHSTDDMLAHAADVDVVVKEPTEAIVITEVPSAVPASESVETESSELDSAPMEDFGAGLLESD